jgi:CheY-like chemotaxis protein
MINAVERAFQMVKRQQILLVEDDLDLARVITEEFGRHGIETHHAATGVAAIELAQEITPDLVILDLVLPDMDGCAVVDWLKDNHRLQSVPVVVYSAAEPTPSQRERLTLGPTEFLTKSRILPDEFERRVIQLLDNMVSAPHGDLHNVA